MKTMKSVASVLLLELLFMSPELKVKVYVMLSHGRDAQV